MYSDLTLKQYINDLSSDKPIPGGGGTSALVAALGVSLALMVARISSKHLDPERQAELNKTIDLLERLRTQAEQGIDLDPRVYQGVMNAYIQKKNIADPKQAQAFIDAALKNSFKLQADMCLLITKAKQLLSCVDSFTKGSIRNDLIVSSALLDGAFKGAHATAKINVDYMKDTAAKEEAAKTLKQHEENHKKVTFE